MRAQVVWLGVGVCFVVGLGIGFMLGRSSTPASGTARDEPAALPARDPAEFEHRRSPSEPLEHSPLALGGIEAQADGDDTHSPERERDPSGAALGSVEAGQARDREGNELDLETEIERLRAEVAALQEERNELFGEPVEAPATVEPRFEGASMSSSIESALREEGVPGSIESTDCSEHPCIVFGRLEGDEEDMEEIERAAALAPYHADVLTLLFWATSIEDARGKAARETGLFALAFYGRDERVRRGEELDRRIRARTMEYWNHDRPGQPSAAESH